MQHSPARKDATPTIYFHIDHALSVGDNDRAMALARQALDAGHRHPMLLNLRGQSKKRGGDVAGALADLQQASALDPKSAVLLSEIAECLNWLGRIDEAMAAAGQALAIDRKLALAWYQKAIAHAALVEYAAARHAFQQSIRLDPKLADALAQFASLESGQGDHAAARRHADAALAMDPGNPIALVARAAADVAQGRLADAEKILQGMLSDRAVAPPMRAAAAAQMGDLRDAQGKPQPAFDAYRESRRAWTGFFEPEIQRRFGEMGCDRVLRITSFVKTLPVHHAGVA